MAEFDSGTLRALHSAQEVAIHTHLHPDRRVPIWVVVAGETVFVRSAYGARGRWYRDLMVRPQATLSLNGRQLPVRATAEHDAEAVAAVSRAYLHKYGTGPYAQAMVKAEVLAFTLRLEPPESLTGSCGS